MKVRGAAPRRCEIFIDLPVQAGPLPPRGAMLQGGAYLDRHVERAAFPASIGPAMKVMIVIAQEEMPLIQISECLEVGLEKSPRAAAYGFAAVLLSEPAGDVAGLDFLSRKADRHRGIQKAPDLLSDEGSNA